MPTDSKVYEKPTVTRIQLRSDEAALAGCKIWFAPVEPCDGAGGPALLLDGS